MSITTPLELDLAVVTISTTVELQSRWPHKLQNSYTAEILTLLKVLGPNTDYPTRGSGKGTDNP